MHDVGGTISTWVIVVLSLILTVALPVMAGRYVGTHNRLRELWVTSRPGVVPAVCAAAIVLLLVSGAACSLGALVYPVLWATVALHVGGIAAILIVILAYNDFKKQELQR